MLAKCSWTKVSIDIDGNNSYLCANACKWHKKNEAHCDLFDQDLHKEKSQIKFTRCIGCKIGTTSNPYIR
jgi:translation initiation factor RLI1